MNLDNINLLDLQTSYMSKDTTVIAMCKALEPVFKQLSKESKLCLIYSQIDNLNDEILDELAWQFHVDFYNVNFPINVKKNLIKNSRKIHRLKGTPASVETLLSSIFGKSELVEWFEYGGEPYMFKVKVQIENNINQLLDNFEESIDTVKNTRSHLEKIELYSTSKSKIYISSSSLGGEDITVYPWSPRDLSSKGNVEIALSNVYNVENVTLYPKEVI